jgi:NADPH:quinone reductase-like Zn-dependent oxidoreductase
MKAAALLMRGVVFATFLWQPVHTFLLPISRPSRLLAIQHSAVAEALGPTLTSDIIDTAANRSRQRHVLVLGATGYIGSAATQELVRRGHQVSAVVRPGTSYAKALAAGVPVDAHNCRLLEGDPASVDSLRECFLSDADGALGYGLVDGVVSCIASRTGAVQECWDIDYGGYGITDEANLCT